MSETNITIDIRAEIIVKRFSAEYLSKLLIAELEKIDADNVVDLKASIAYRKKFNEWKEGLSSFSNYIKYVTSKAEEVVELAKKMDSDSSKKLTSVTDELLASKFDYASWEENYIGKLGELNLEYQTLISKNKIGLSAVKALFGNSLLEIISLMAVFALSFTLSYFVGQSLENAFEELGPFFSKLITAIFFFVTFDKLIDKIKDKLRWQTVKYLNQNFQDVTLNIKTTKEILNALKK